MSQLRKIPLNHIKDPLIILVKGCVGLFALPQVHRVHLNDPKLHHLDFACFRVPPGWGAEDPMAAWV